MVGNCGEGVLGIDRTVSGDGANFRPGPEYVRAGFSTGLDIGDGGGGQVFRTFKQKYNKITINI